MGEKTMVIKNNFNVVDYVSLIDGLVSEFFDDGGEYTPHIGRLNAMRLFYNKCVVESKFDLPHDFEDALLMDVLVGDAEFIEAFNDAVRGDGTIRCDFANAYAEAMEIVDAQKGTFGQAVNIIKNALSGISDAIKPLLEKENLSNITDLANYFAGGNQSAEAIVERIMSKVEKEEK